MIRFANGFFLFLIIPLIYFSYKKFKQEDKKGFRFSSLKILRKHSYKKTYLHKIPCILLSISMALLIIALARPYNTSRNMSLSEWGIDIAIVLDLSGSMSEKDFFPNRLEAAKKYLNKFIRQRPYDRFSLVVFGGDAYTKVPLTLDHDLLLQILQETSLKDVSDRGTAIGKGMAAGINRLKDSESESKIMILLTDGVNNRGVITPEVAGDIAVAFDVKVYTIGIGKDERYNERLLKDIAERSNGVFYKVNDSRALNDLFENINELEKVEVEDQIYYLKNEYAFILIRIGLLLLLFTFLFDKIIFLKIP